MGQSEVNLEDDEDFLGAVASNAGDDFHVIWAAREMLRLLDADGDVSAVKVEGPPRDEVHAHIGEHGQAADITLTRNTPDGYTYRYLQLKHSASNPQDAWSWSRLLTRRAKTKPLSSVLGKLAGLLKAVEFKGDFAIVTNQPLSATVAADIARLIKGGSKPALADKELFSQLTKELGLTASQVVTFLKAWDITGFASTSRLIMESEVIQRLACLADADARDDANLLQKRVATLMLPESRKDPAVTREVLWVWLGAGSKRMLFPAPSEIEPARPYVRRVVIDRLGEQLAKPQLKPLRIHAGGGCGKTSLICDIPSVLPQDSEIFIYDCYGGGLFLTSDQKRHHPEQAFTQLGNEIAARLRTSLVMRRKGSIDVFEAFRSRVEVAAGVLSARSSSAQLVLCFDAVDNARTGAQHWQESCFLDVLSQASAWPNNVRVIVSCRTARRGEVGDKQLYEDFEVPSFDLDEVRQLVALWQPEWRPDLATTFEHLTGGNPRRLVYAIKGLASDEEMQAVARLMPKAEGINPLFEQRVKEAGIHFGDPDKVWQVLDALSRLPRPVPGRILAALAELDPESITDISADVGGIVEHEEGWTFHDEDFERFVIERPDSNGADLLARAADLLLAARHTDRYAATSIAEVLAAANRPEALYTLVTQDETASEVLSPLESQFVWSRRLGLAIRYCRKAGDTATACSLLIAAAEAIQRVKLLEELTVENLDLSVRFAVEEANRLVLIGQRHRKKRPRLRIELARLTALTHPETADMHLRWWGAYLSDLSVMGSASDIQILPKDISAEYQVRATLFDEEIAFAGLFEWRPKSVLHPVFVSLAESTAGRNRQALLDAIDARAWPPLGLAPLMAAALLAGVNIDNSVMRGGLERLAKATRARWNAPTEGGLPHSPLLAWQESVLLVCECAVVHDDFKPLVAQILDRAIPTPKFKETHDLFRLRSAGARHARAFALRELLSGNCIPIAKWLPPRRDEPSSTDHRSRSREKSPERYWNESLAATVTAFSRFVEAARITLASLSANPVSAWPALAAALDVSRSYDQSPRRDPDEATLLMRNHLVHAGIGGGNVSGLIVGMRKVLRNWSADSIASMQNLASTLALIPHTHDAALLLLTELADEIQTCPLPASERVKLLSKSAKIALPLDDELADWLFGRAVEATASVDYEARSALAAAGAIAQAGLGVSSLEGAVFAVRLGDAAGKVAESLGISSDFDWSEVAGWITATDIPAGLAAAARWHDWGNVSIDHSLPIVIATAGSALSLAQRVSLATLASDGPIDLDAALGDSSAIPNWMVESILAAQLREGQIDAFLLALNKLECKAGADTSGVIAAAKVHLETFLSWQVEGEKNPQSCEEVMERDTNKEDTTTLKSQDEIRAALESGAGKRGPEAYQFCQVAERVESLRLRVPFLDIALELGRYEGELGEAVPEILRSWSNYPPVITWMRERFPIYISGALSKLFRWRHDETDIVEAALAATKLAPAEQAAILLDGIEQLGERIAPDLLYTLTGLIAARTATEERSGLFDALLRRVEERASHPSSVLLANISPPQDIAESVARSIYAAMGDMDRRVRWRACHGALALLRSQDPAWDKLVSCLDNTEERVFAGAHFYRYAALEQLMMVLLRATEERVQDVARHTPLILKTIRKEPHVLIRELGRSVLLEVDKAGAWDLSPEDRKFVEQTNRSQLPPISQRTKYPRRTSEEKRRQRKYSFDETDAIPYWYQPAARIFGIQMDDFLDRLENWIHDKWGYGETDTHWVHEPRLSRIEGMHDLTSRRHGARPTVERLSHHIEWHSMMCVVGELICEYPLVTEQMDENPLETWMERNLPTLSPYWLSDYRTVAPLEPRFWGLSPAELPARTNGFEAKPAAAKAWGRSISSDVFDTEINASHDLVVAADFELRWHEASQRVQIHSALVSPSAAHSLAQALANTRDRMDFALPDGRYHEDIDVPEFQLEAWLQPSDDDPYADKYDERRGTASGIPVELVGAANSENSAFDGELFSRCSPTGSTLIKIAQWGNEEGENGNGWRATANRTYITELLKRVDRSLILLVEVSRQLRDEDIQRNEPQWVLYVLDAEGTLTRVERERRSLGRALVRREGLENSVDTLGRWMLHRAAELDQERRAADEEQRALLDLEVEKLCAEFRQRDNNRF